MKKILSILLLVASVHFVNAQDLHFSQYFNSPLLINPANTGFSPGDQWRLGMNYRKQWASLINNPYQTFDAWGDAQLLGDKIENGWLGVGAVINRDAAGSANLTSTSVYGSVAYHQMLGVASLISTGFGAGWVNKRVDPTKLIFDNQWNGQFFDIAVPSGENFAATAVNYFDFHAGINYAYFPTENTYLNAGIALQHINAPKESFFSAATTNAKVDMRYTFFLNGSLKLNDRWIINPNIYYSSMSSSTETVIGMNAHYNLSGDGSAQLIGGLYYRNADALMPMVGYQWGTAKLTVSYDATISSLSKYNQNRGAYELSLIKTGIFSNGLSATKCPAVKF